MQIDPAHEWRRLTEHYRSLSDQELRELAFDFTDLTELAQQVLRTELSLRRINLPTSADEQAKTPPPRVQAPPAWPSHEEFPSDTDQTEEDDGLPHAYTWKTQLCECETAEQAWQLGEMLRRAGIESWTEGPQSGLVYYRILVPADHLDQARAVADRPIPQDVIDESRQTLPEFVLPACPTCGAADPLLAGIDPVNTWRCEFCGREWTDPAGIPTQT
jgi:hypothetical protein